MITNILIVSNAAFGIWCAFLIRKNGLLKVALRKVKAERNEWQINCQTWKSKYHQRILENPTQVEKEVQAAWMVILRSLFPNRKY
jgi:hypothetical protein